MFLCFGSLCCGCGKRIVYLKAPIKRVTRAQVPVPHSPVLEREMLISEEKLIKAVKEYYSKELGR